MIYNGNDPASSLANVAVALNRFIRSLHPIHPKLHAPAPEPELFSTSCSLDDEIEHANTLAKVLGLALRFLPEMEQHAVVDINSQLTIGEIVRMTLAEHAALRNLEGVR